MAKKRKALAPLPRITGKTITVGALLMHIRQLILDEPHRLDMGGWISAFKGRIIQDLDSPMPACGTVACMAGWGATLLRPSNASGQTLNSRAERAMTNALGFDEERGGTLRRSVGSLFSPYASCQFDEGDVDMPMPGTVKHAKLIARRIRKYMKAHPEILDREIDVALVRSELAGRPRPIPAGATPVCLGVTESA